MNNVRHPSLVLAGLALASLVPLLAVGCGAEPPVDVGEAAGVDDAVEPVGEAASALGTCFTVQRGIFGNVRDAQLARRLGTALATDPDANANFGALPSAKVGSQAGPPKMQWKSLLGFDLSFIPANATVTSATVTLDTTSAGAGTVRVKRVTAPWVENLVTFRNWNNAQASNDEASFASTGGTRSFDLTALSQAWVSGAQANNGVVLLEESPTSTFSTSEVTQGSLRPKLSICYTSPTPCAPNPCQNGGTCTSSGGAATCACPAGYSGAQCEVPSCPCRSMGGWGAGWLVWPGDCSIGPDSAVAYVTGGNSHVDGFGVGFNDITGQNFCGWYSTYNFNQCYQQDITPLEAISCRQDVAQWGSGLCFGVSGNAYPDCAWLQ